MSKRSNDPLSGARAALAEGAWDAARDLAIDQLARTPACLDAQLIVAECFYRSGQLDAAASQVSQALKIDPEAPAARRLAAAIAARRGHWANVLDHLDVVRAGEPDNLDLLANIGTAALNADRPDVAEQALRRVLTLKPDHEAALLGLANIARAAGDAETARAYYRSCLSVAPGNARAHNNLSSLLQQAGDFAAAEHHFSRAITLDPAFAEAHKGLAMLKLLQGDFADGFEAFRWRWRQRRSFNRYRHGDLPAWTGQGLAGRRILVWGEQGIGDEIMFASLIPDIAAAANFCVIECAPRLVPLFARSFAEAMVIARTDPPSLPEDLDFQCATGDACAVLRTDRAAFSRPIAFLKADPDKIGEVRRRYRSHGAGPLIGIAWHSRTPLWGAVKSAPLAHWGPVLTLADCRFVSLQYGPTEGDRADAKARFGADIHQDPLIDQMRDLDAFAAQAAAMDLVITTSNTTAHMAGALGLPTLIVLPHVPDWRWQASGDRALWYQDAHLVRQPRPGDWAQAFERTAAIARERIGA